MTQLHWFPMYSEKWLSSAAISAMLPEQEGAFVRLLNLMWMAADDQEPSLTTDDKELARMSRLGPRWRKLGGPVRSQFVERNGRLYNATLSGVWREQQERHAKAVTRARKAGKASGKHRANPKSTSSAPEVNHSSISMVLREDIDSLSRGAGAVPDGGPAPALERQENDAVRDVRGKGGFASLGEIIGWPKPRHA